MNEEKERLIVGALLVITGSLLTLGGSIRGPLGAMRVLMRGCDLMELPPITKTDAAPYIEAMAAVLMAKWQK